MSKKLEFLTEEDRRPVKGTILILKLLAGLIFLFLIILETVAISSDAWSDGKRWIVIIPVIIVVLSSALALYPYRWFPMDASKGMKVVEDTRVMRVKKLGWAGVDAGGGMSNTLFGSIFYLYIPDDSRRSGKRKMRIKMRAYRYLKSGDNIHIEYLPKSGIILSIDCGSFHYVPWEKKLQSS